MVRAKNNLAAGGVDQTLAFCFASREVGIDPNNDKPIVAPYVAWEAAHVDVSAVEAMQAANEFKSPIAHDSAKQFLHNLLVSGPRRCDSGPAYLSSFDLSPVSIVVASAIAEDGH
jgi:hypothetical protein